jgi:chromosome segregation ATPase
MDVTLQVQPQTALDAGGKIELEWLQQEYAQLLEQKKALEVRVRKSEERRRALMHILGDLNTLNRKLADQRKAMIHILADYEKDRSRLARQSERLDNSRRALMHTGCAPVQPALRE